MANIYVYPKNREWALKRLGGPEAKMFRTQKKAVAEGRVMARAASPSQLVVLSRGGLIRASIPYGFPKILRHPLRSPIAKKIERAVGLLALERITADERG